MSVRQKRGALVRRKTDPPGVQLTGATNEIHDVREGVDNVIVMQTHW